MKKEEEGRRKMKEEGRGKEEKTSLPFLKETSVGGLPHSQLSFPTSLGKAYCAPLCLEDKLTTTVAILLD